MSAVRAAAVCAALAIVMLPAPARARSGAVVLDTAACSEVSEPAIRQIVGIEIGDLLGPPDGAPPPDGYRLVARCANGAAQLEARAADGSDRLARTLRLDDFPGDAAPRALALAGIEMLAALDPAVRARIEVNPSVPASVPSDRFALAVTGVRRAFFGSAGAAAWGGRVALERRLGRFVAAGDLEVDRSASTVALGEARAWLASLGAFAGVVAAGGRFAGSLAAGARAGLAWLSGDPAAGSGLVGQQVTRPWWGPALAANAALGGASIAATASVEAGWAVQGAQGLAGGGTAIAIDGGWVMVGLGVRF